MADTVIGVSLRADDGVSPKVKDIKRELKEAQRDVVTLSEKFGATSKEAANAAKKAAELKDQIGDAKSLVDAFNPDTKFRAFGAAINTVVGGFTALTGSMALLGVESESVQKTLLKVQSALALSQGVAQLQEGIQSFKNFAAVIRSSITPLQAVVVGVLAAGAAVIAWLSSTNRQTAAQKALNETTKEYSQAAADATQKVAEVRTALELARTGVMNKDEALKTYNETLGDAFGRTNDLATAEKNLADKADAYIKMTALKAQANALFAEAAKESAKAMILQDQLIKSSLLDGNSNYKRLADKVVKDINDAKSNATEIERLASSLIKEATQIATAFDIITNPTKPTKTTKTDKETYQSQRDGIVSVTDALMDQQSSLRNLADIKEVTDIRIQASDNAKTINFLKNKAEETRAQQEALIIEEYIANRRAQLAQSVGQALGALSDLVGKQTAAGKVLAIAEATINTYLAASNILKNTARNPVTGAIPGFAIAQMIATIAAGLVTVRNIVKTPVPGAGGSSPSAVSAPVTPQLPESTRTRLDQDQLNQIGNAAVRAFVIESDVSTNQERIRRINRQARL